MLSRRPERERLAGSIRVGAGVSEIFHPRCRRGSSEGLEAWDLGRDTDHAVGVETEALRIIQTSS